jgi:septal ring factor EnvC (AmiA/AmiB activator)
MKKWCIKKSNSIVLAALFLCFILSTSISFAQQKETKNELENKKKQLQKDIEYTNELLNETKKNKKLSLNQLVTLNKKISAREELINTINREIALLDKQVKEKNNNIQKLQTELDKLKQDYAKMIYYAYKNQNAYDRLVFIFASKDFEQAYMRMKYLQQYSSFRKKQAEAITNKRQELNTSLQELELKKSDKRVLLGSEITEKQNLSVEKSEKESVLTSLQRQESELKKELEKKRKDAQKIQQAIQRIIQKELELAQKKASANNKPKSDKLVLTPESLELSNSFANNKGKLPWPVAKGIISERFGTHPHPLMPNIDVNNNGLDISTNTGALARAVFDGEVTGVATIPGAGQIIIIRHGEFLSVYANLKDVYVKGGDKITTKQNIGSILQDADDSKTILHIEIWKGQTKLDPESWLYKTN